MAITVADPHALGMVRQLEALMARAWPAEHIDYDGTYAIRRTHGHPSRRLNSVVPLDPADDADFATRLQRLCIEGNLALKTTPLAPPALMAWLQKMRWNRVLNVHNMVLDLQKASIKAATYNGPHAMVMCDIDNYVQASALNHIHDNQVAAALRGVIERIKSETIPLIYRDDGLDIANLLIVRDGSFAGILDFAILPQRRGQKIGSHIMDTLLIMMQEIGVEKMWLQVSDDNTPAIRLYSKYGFQTLYDYQIWEKP